MTVVITPADGPIGVEVSGLSGAALVHPEVAAQCQELLDRHGVVAYRGAALDDDQLIEFTALLGTPVRAATGEHERPEIQTITLDPSRTHEIMVSYRQGNFFWHIDGATDVTPQKGTLLQAHATADPGEGATEFASTYLAYETLPAADQALIEDLRVRHSFAAAQGRAHPDAPQNLRAQWDRVPVREHPLVWKRADGRRSLLVGATADRIIGWDEDESRALLDRLEAWATRPDHVLRHEWQEGDLVTWDNTGMLHRALRFDPTSPRLLHRTTLAGVEAVT